MEDTFENKLKEKIINAIHELEKEGYKNTGVQMVFNDSKKVKWKHKKHFIKVYDEMFDMIKFYKLDAYELATIMQLMEFVEYETNLIAMDGIPLNKSDIITILGYSESKAEEVIKNLVSKKILAKTRVGKNVIFHKNPRIAFRGIFLSKETESIFREIEG
jgi:ribosome-binding factor A